LLWAIAILFIGILFFILIKLIGLRLRYRRYNRVETKEAILLYYSFFIQVLKRMGYKIEAGEMPTEYSERIDNSIYFKENGFQAITEVFIRAKYSNEHLSDNEKQVCEKFYHNFLYQLRRDVGIIKYLVFI